MRRLLLGSACALLVASGAQRTRAQSAPPSQALWVWGSNWSGQLGTPTQNGFIPNQLDALSDAIAIAAGTEHTLALRPDGSVWAWGDNAYGQLGQGNLDPSLAPVQVPSLSGITAISAGGEFSLAYRQSDGKLWAWGSNGNGQLAQPTSLTYTTTPLEIAGLPPLQAIDAGRWHALALDTSGQVWAWGNDSYGQLGDAGTTDSSTPIAVNIPATVSSLGAGAFHNLVVDSDGSVWGFGLNSFGQLGRGNQNGWTEPVAPGKVLGLPHIVKASAGSLHSIALTDDGDVYGWGYNTSGQVGDGSVLLPNTGRLLPARLAVSGIADIDAGNIHALARASDGSLWTWGGASRGATGENSQHDSRVPTLIPGISNVSLLAAGGSHSVVLANARPPLQLFASGDNSHGELGNGTLDPSSTPARSALALSAVTALAAGSGHSLALDPDGTLWAWGANDRGQLGLTDGDRAQPSAVPLPLGAGQRVSRVAAGGHHSLAVRSDGTVWAWGANDRGQLGDGTTNDHASPVQVPGLAHIAAVAASDQHSLALASDGTVYAWGDNTCLQLAQPASVTMNAVPAQVSPLYSVLAIAAGSCHSIALVTYGALRVWGSNERGQFGTGSVGGRQAEPYQVPIIDDAVAIAAGAWHSVVLRSDGSVWAFGDASLGQLGDGTHYEYAFARQTLGAGPAELVAAGDFDGLAANHTGGVWGWGTASSSEIGLGASGEYPTAIAVDAGHVRLLALGTAHALFGVEAQ